MIITKDKLTIMKENICINDLLKKDDIFNDLCQKNERRVFLVPPKEIAQNKSAYGGIYHYRKTNPFVTDYSLNVVNSASCYELYRLGAARVTLSYELNKRQIEDLINAYYEENDGHPALEMIVYGRAPLMFTKYCPMKKMNQCSICKRSSYELKDEQGTFPIISHDDCTTTILNGKILNLLDELQSIKGIKAFRLNFTVESKEQVVKTINKALGKLNGSKGTSVFRRHIVQSAGRSFCIYTQITYKYFLRFLFLKNVTISIKI